MNRKAVLASAVSEATDLRNNLLDNVEIIQQIKNISKILRKEMLQYRNWTFDRSFSTFENPPSLRFFLKIFCSAITFREFQT